VLAIDLRGMGETGPKDGQLNAGRHLLGEYRPAMTALLTGKTMIGMRALDVTRGIDLLASRNEVDPARISAAGRGTATLPVLFAALFDKRISSLALDGMPGSYDSMLRERLGANMAEQVIPSALQYFDLPDVIAAIAPRRVLLYNPINPLGETLGDGEVRSEFGAPGTLTVALRTEQNEPFSTTLASWMGKQ
jgi:hypothetical protein